MRTGRLTSWGAVGVTLSSAAIMATFAAWYSPTADEIAQLPAALHHIEQRRFELARANPPLVRLVAAIPVVAAGYRPDWRRVDPSPTARSEFTVGSDFLVANQTRLALLFPLARWACLPLALVGAWVCWRWARELYGTSAGLAALTLWSFCPNVLGNGALLTPDVGCASLGSLAAFLFWRWLRAPSWTSAALAGAALGLANLTKFAWLILFPLWPMLTLFWIIATPGGEPRNVALRRAAHLIVMFVLAVAIINALYLADGTCTPLQDYPFHSATLGWAAPVDADPAVVATNRFRGTLLGRIPVPLPKQYVQGLDTQLTAFEQGRPAYLFGEWKHGGWWYYYVAAALFKIPLGAWVLGAIALYGRFRHHVPANVCRNEVILLTLAVAYLLAISLLGGINRHFRYVLPSLPFIYIWLSSTVPHPQAGLFVPRKVVFGAIGWFVISSIAVLPHSQTYFNELCGGPRYGHRVLLGSNVDWGQNLFFVQRWVQQHPEAQPLYLALSYGGAPPEYFGIRGQPIPQQAQPGWYVVSVNRLYDPTSSCTYLHDHKPIAAIAYSIQVFYIPSNSFQDISQSDKSAP